MLHECPVIMAHNTIHRNGLFIKRGPDSPDWVKTPRNILCPDPPDSRWPLFSSDSLWSRPWWPYARWSWCSSWGPPPSFTFVDGCRFCRVSKKRVKECHNNESNETEMQHMQHHVTVRCFLWLRSFHEESVGEWVRKEMSFAVHNIIMDIMPEED